jgi:hypothetical protein
MAAGISFPHPKPVVDRIALRVGVLCKLPARGGGLRAATEGTPMLRSQRRSFSLALALAALLAPASVEAVNIKNVPEPFALGPRGDIIDRAQVALPARLLKGIHPERIRLELQLTEQRTDGSLVALGTFVVPRLTDATVVTLDGPDGPDGRVLVEMTGSTPSLQRGSNIFACLRVIEREERAEGTYLETEMRMGEQCRTLGPGIP